MNFPPQRRGAQKPARRAWCLCWLLLLNACAQPPPVPVAESAATFAPALNHSVEPVRTETVNRIFTRSCSTCHGPDGHGLAAIAPDLRRVKARSLEQWQQYLSTSHPGAQMPPPTWVNVDEIKVIADYLVNLTFQEKP